MCDGWPRILPVEDILVIHLEADYPVSLWGLFLLDFPFERIYDTQVPSGAIKTACFVEPDFYMGIDLYHVSTMAFILVPLWYKDSYN